MITAEVHTPTLTHFPSNRLGAQVTMAFNNVHFETASIECNTNRKPRHNIQSFSSLQRLTFWYVVGSVAKN